MGAAEAKAFYDSQGGDPATGYITPDRAKGAIDQIYTDQGNDYASIGAALDMAVPADGTTGQVLARASNAPLDNEWIDAPSGAAQDTGWRNILAGLQAVDPGLTTRAGFSPPRIRRIGNVLHYAIGVTVTVANADWADAMGMRTTGWRPNDISNYQIPANRTGSAGVFHWANAIYMKPWATGDYYLIESHVTDEAWPTVMPGIAWP